MTNNTSVDEILRKIGSLHAYNYEGDDTTIKVMVDDDILESIARYITSYTKQRELALLERLEEPTLEDVMLMQPDHYEGGKIINDYWKAAIQKEKEKLV